MKLETTNLCGARDDDTSAHGRSAIGSGDRRSPCAPSQTTTRMPAEAGVRPIADPQPSGGALTAVIPRANRCIPASWTQGRALSQ
jgi:hypothetical protein